MLSMPAIPLSASARPSAGSARTASAPAATAPSSAATPLIARSPGNRFTPGMMVSANASRVWVGTESTGRSSKAGLLPLGTGGSGTGGRGELPGAASLPCRAAMGLCHGEPVLRERAGGEEPQVVAVPATSHQQAQVDGVAGDRLGVVVADDPAGAGGRQQFEARA